MKKNIKNNKKNFIISIVFPIATVLMIGGHLFMWWYYFSIPLLAYFITLFFNPKTMLLAGINIAIIITYVPFFYLSISGNNMEGAGLLHLFPLPGLAFGVVFSAFYMRKKPRSELATFLIGLLISLLGFFGYLLCGWACMVF